MREIKFRAWDKRYKTMQYLEMTGERHVSEALIIKGNRLTRNDELSEWMQYTGLKDKNGTEIYEGDIIEIDDNDLQFAIYWEEKCAGFWFKTMNKNQTEIQHQMVSPKLLKVIGNIYENPKLIEEK